MNENDIIKVVVHPYNDHNHIKYKFVYYENGNVVPKDQISIAFPVFKFEGLPFIYNNLTFTPILSVRGYKSSFSVFIDSFKLNEGDTYPAEPHFLFYKGCKYDSFLKNIFIVRDFSLDTDLSIGVYREVIDTLRLIDPAQPVFVEYNFFYKSYAYTYRNTTFSKISSIISNDDILKYYGSCFNYNSVRYIPILKQHNPYSFYISDIKSDKVEPEYIISLRILEFECRDFVYSDKYWLNTTFLNDILSKTSETQKFITPYKFHYGVVGETSDHYNASIFDLNLPVKGDDFYYKGQKFFPLLIKEDGILMVYKIDFSEKENKINPSSDGLILHLNRRFKGCSFYTLSSNIFPSRLTGISSDQNFYLYDSATSLSDLTEYLKTVFVFYDYDISSFKCHNGRFCSNSIFMSSLYDRVKLIGKGIVFDDIIYTPLIKPEGLFDFIIIDFLVLNNTCSSYFSSSFVDELRDSYLGKSLKCYTEDISDFNKFVSELKSNNE